MQTDVIPLTKTEMDLLMLEVEREDEYDYLLFLLLKTTGRRIGEIYGIEEKTEVGRKKVGQKIIYIEGTPKLIDRTVIVYKKTGKSIYGVQVKDIDFQKGTMKVWVLKRRQYIQDETILSPEVLRLLDRFIKKNRLNLNDYIFRQKGKTLRTIQNRVKKYAEKAGIPHKVKIHNFRHYFITELKRQGWTNDMIVKLTGHKTPSILQIYDHIVATDIKDKALEAIKGL